MEIFGPKVGNVTHRDQKLSFFDKARQLVAFSRFGATFVNFDNGLQGLNVKSWQALGNSPSGTH